MGTSRAEAERLLDFEDRGLIPPAGLIAEFGAQEFMPPLSADEALSVFTRRRPRLTPSVGEAERIGAERWTAALYEALGFRYVSFDIALGRSTRYTDLNRESVPDDMRGRADLVTNFGTTEHIINQMNCFEFIHDLTKPGGIIWHNLPASDYLGHGFFKYDVNFFFTMARSNDYEILEWRTNMHVNSDEFYRTPDFFHELGLPRLEPRASSVEFVFRKRHDAPFAPPIDAPIEMIERVVFRLRPAAEKGRLFIYGAGSVGEGLARALTARGVPVAGFLDTLKDGTRAGLPIRRFADYHPGSDDVIVVASSFAEEIRRTLNEAGIVPILEVTEL